MKYRILVFFTLSLLLFSCNTNLLNYRLSPHYSESKQFNFDEKIKLHQSFCFNLKGVIDEEYWLDVDILILDTIQEKRIKKLNIKTDTSIIKVNFNVYSVWYITKEYQCENGTIEIVKWRRNKIKIKENLKFINQYFPKANKLKGTRTFKIRHKNIKGN